MTNETTQPFDRYQELAEAKLQNQLLSQRLTMMTKMATGYMNRRAHVCQQLEVHGLTLNTSDLVVEIHK